MTLDILFRKIEERQKGFTILELMITIFIFTIGVLGVYAVSQSSISDVRYLNDRSSAIHLCQEGIEIIKNLRDGNFLSVSSPPWDQGLTTTGYYEADYHASVLNPPLGCSPSCNYNNLNPIKFSSAELYNYTTGTNTKFKRKIYLERVSGADDYLKVIVTVYWRDRGDHFVVMQDNLYGYWNP